MAEDFEKPPQAPGAFEKPESAGDERAALPRVQVIREQIKIGEDLSDEDVERNMKISERVKAIESATTEGTYPKALQEDLKGDELKIPVELASYLETEKEEDAVERLWNKIDHGVPLDGVFNDVFTKGSPEDRKALKLLGTHILYEHAGDQLPGQDAIASWQSRSEDEKQTIRLAQMMVQTAEMATVAQKLSQDPPGINRAAALNLYNSFMKFSDTHDVPIWHRRRLQQAAIGIAEKFDPKVAESLKKKREEKTEEARGRVFERSVTKQEARAKEQQASVEQSPTQEPSQSEKFAQEIQQHSEHLGEWIAENAPGAQGVEQSNLPPEEKATRISAEKILRSVQENNEWPGEEFREAVMQRAQEKLRELGLGDAEHLVVLDRMEEQMEYSAFRQKHREPGNVFNIPLRFKQFYHWIGDMALRADSVGLARMWGRKGKANLRELRFDVARALEEASLEIKGKEGASESERVLSEFMGKAAMQYLEASAAEEELEEKYDLEADVVGTVVGQALAQESKRQAKQSSAIWSFITKPFRAGKEKRLRKEKEEAAVKAEAERLRKIVEDEKERELRIREKEAEAKVVAAQADLERAKRGDPRGKSRRKAA